MDSPSSFLPQQLALPSARSPQVCLPLAEIWVKVPAGTVVCPYELSPQQVAVPLARSPHAWTAPAEIWVKLPGDGLDSP